MEALTSGLLLLRRTKKDDPHMNSSGIALSHFQHVGQPVTSVPPPQRNMLIVQPRKEKGNIALRRLLIVAIGELAGKIGGSLGGDGLTPILTVRIGQSLLAISTDYPARDCLLPSRSSGRDLRV